MQVVQEVTQWDAEIRQPNHIYLLEGTRALAYIPFSEGKAIWFSVPIQFDKRGRKFTKLKKNPFGTKPSKNLIEVAGSKGNTYFVDPAEKTCTCPGYQYRSHCKHLESV